jgi:hypothetical protein
MPFQVTVVVVAVTALTPTMILAPCAIATEVIVRELIALP